jgi:hypothetical protein
VDYRPRIGGVQVSGNNSRGITLRKFTLEPTTAPVSPIVIELGHKIMRTPTSMYWERTGSLIFEWRERRLFMAFEAGGEFRSVPEWTLLVLQNLPETIEQIQSPKPLFITLPGRKKKRRATQGETEMAVMVGLRRSRKKWDDIALILGHVSKKVMDERIQEIERIFPDIRKMSHRGTIRPQDCERLNPAWIRHNEPGPHRRTGRKTLKVR